MPALEIRRRHLHGELHLHHWSRLRKFRVLSGVVLSCEYHDEQKIHCCHSSTRLSKATVHTPYQESWYGVVELHSHSPVTGCPFQKIRTIELEGKTIKLQIVSNPSLPAGLSIALLWGVSSQPPCQHLLAGHCTSYRYRKLCVCTAWTM